MAPYMEVRTTVMAFGQLAEIMGANMPVNGIKDTNDLVQYLEEKFPQVKEIPYKIAVNKKIITGNTMLDENSIVALLPPYSGG